MIDCLTALPCCCSRKNTIDGSLQGREVCPAWRMLPGVLALAACVTGIALSLLQKNPYLCILFGPGAAASVYLTYLGYVYKDLKTLHQSSSELKTTNAALKMRLDELSSSNDELKKTGTDLNHQVAFFKELSAQHKTDLLASQENNRSLKENIGQMDAGIKQLRDQLEVQNGQGADNLTGLKRALDALRTENNGLSELRDELVQLLAPMRNEEYKKACEKWSQIKAEILAAEATLPELKRVKESYEALLAKAASFFQALESQGNQHIQNLGDAARAFQTLKTEFENLLQK